MSSGLKYSVGAYRNRVRMSETTRFLLVEGSDDKRIFSALKREFAKKAKLWNELVIHAAEDLTDARGLGEGNREIVETISASIGEEQCGDRYVGFVDREYRGFSLNYAPTDDISDHHIVGRLVWTRGHSIENYFFDWISLERALQVFVLGDEAETALTVVEKQLSRIILIACALSLAGLECDNRLNLVRASIDWRLIRISSDRIDFDRQLWRRGLLSKQQVDPALADRLVASAEQWIDRLTNAEVDLIRWLCHGHLGLRFLWATYAACAHSAGTESGTPNADRIAQRVLAAEEAVRLNACANSWISGVVTGLAPFPRLIFGMLSLPLPDSKA